jgi:uncharacterized membrane protein YsdA (DUF1294 family)
VSGGLVVLAGWLAAVNAVTAAAYAFDKIQARRHGRRIAERRLYLLNLAGGFAGAWLVFLGMRHKTLHRSFWIVQSAATLMWLLVIGVMLLA